MTEFQQVIQTVQALALDVAGRDEDQATQEALAEVIQGLLQRGYQISLFSSKEKDELAAEEFDFPGLAVIPAAGPPWEALARAQPPLTAPTTLWVTENRELQQWLAGKGLPFVCFEKAVAPGVNGLRLGRLNDLLALLNPTARAAEAIAAAIAERRAGQSRQSLLVGLGGPPESGFQSFGLALKERLEALDVPLVNLMDLSSLLYDAAATAAQQAPDGPWEHPAAGAWVVENVLQPLREGSRVYLETAPEHLPPGFQPHFPLFLSEETVVLVMAEMLFIPAVHDLLDFSILLELSPEETTRRLYEIEPGKLFDVRFTEQYLAREGGAYRDYLQRHDVSARVSVRLDAGKPGALTLVG